MKSKLAMIIAGIISAGSVFADVPTAVASVTGSPAPTPQASSLPSLGVLVVFVLIFYFLLIRPQMKRSKEQRQLVNSLDVGDEVLTSGGFYGKIVSLDTNTVEVAVADKVVLKMQKQAIVSLIPKGTVSTVESA